MSKTTKIGFMYYKPVYLCISVCKGHKIFCWSDIDGIWIWLVINTRNALHKYKPFTIYNLVGAI